MKANDTQAPVQFDTTAEGNFTPPPVTDDVMADGAQFAALMKQQPNVRKGDETATEATPQTQASEAMTEGGQSSMPAMPSLAKFDKAAGGGAKTSKDDSAPDAVPEAGPNLALTPTQSRERAIMRKALGLDAAMQRKPAKKSHAGNVEHEKHQDEHVAVDAGAVVATSVPVSVAANASPVKAESKLTRQEHPKHHKVEQTHALPVASRAFESRTAVSRAPDAISRAPSSRTESQSQSSTRTRVAPQHDSPPMQEQMQAPAQRAEVEAPVVAQPPIEQTTEQQATIAQAVAASTDFPPAPAHRSADLPKDQDAIDAGTDMPEPMRQEKMQEVAQARVAQELGAQVMAQQVHLNQVNTTPQDSPLVEIIKEL
jgi:hypothetical protein